MCLFYVYEIIVVNGFVVEVCGVLGFVVLVLSYPKSGNDAARTAVPVLLFEAYRAMWVVGGVPRPFVAHIEAVRKFFCEEYCFEPVEVVRGYLTATHDVFEDYTVVAPGIFEQGDDCRNAGLVLDQPMTGYEYASFAEAHPYVECACATGDLLFNGCPLAPGEGL